MRIIAILSLLLLLVTGCGSKNTEPAEAPATAASATETESVKPALPVGTVVFADGSTLELTSFLQGDPILLRITGKLSGRTPTLIQMTRVDDLRSWRGITFESPDTFSVSYRNNKEFRFTDATLTIGGEGDVITFMNKEVGEELKEVSVPKANIKLISFTPVPQED